MPSRRAFLKGVLPAAAVIAVAPLIADEDEDICEYYAKCLAAAMKNKHGGQWKPTFDHFGEFAVISKLSA